jgi:hypothetical protein
VTNTGLDRQLLGDSVLSPSRVLSTDPTNKSDVVIWDPRTTRRA